MSTLPLRSVGLPRPVRRFLLACAAALALTPAAAQAYPVHQVLPGETLTGIAAANGMAVARLAAANGLPWNAQVVVGHLLQVPPRDGLYTSTTGQTMGMATSSTPVSASAVRTSSVATTTTAVRHTTTSSASSGSSTYVRPGDTLSAIAARLGVSLSALAAANGITTYNLIYSGTTLRAPAPGTTSIPAPYVVPHPSTSSTGPEGHAATTGVGATPTAQRLTSSQIASIAAQNGVPGNLAAAIAWQESGNNNAMVSSVGARGVMQVMPGTWDWINTTLAHPPLNRASAADNVRAGSLLLKQLLAQTGGNVNTAIAGYYQGLGSVRQRGLYDDTKQYVANVNAIRARLGG